MAAAYGSYIALDLASTAGLGLVFGAIGAAIYLGIKSRWEYSDANNEAKDIIFNTINSHNGEIILKI